MNLIPAPASLVPASRGADPTSGLYYYGYQYYDPVTGRRVTINPLPPCPPFSGKRTKKFDGLVGNVAVEAKTGMGGLGRTDVRDNEKINEVAHAKSVAAYCEFDYFIVLKNEPGAEAWEDNMDHPAEVEHVPHGGWED